LARRRRFDGGDDILLITFEKKYDNHNHNHHTHNEVRFQFFNYIGYGGGGGLLLLVVPHSRIDVPFWDPLAFHWTVWFGRLAHPDRPVTGGNGDVADWAFGGVARRWTFFNWL
jgi:hypothetical protein